MNTLNQKELLSRKPWVVGVFTFFTATLYSLYWFYKQFKAVGEKRPILKTIFSFVFAFQLFPKLQNKTDKANKAKSISYAVLYLLITVAINTVFVIKNEVLYITILLILTALLSFVLAGMQKIAMKSVSSTSNRTYSTSELAWVIVGISIFAIGISAFLLLAPQNTIDARYAEIDKRLDASQKVERDLYQKNEVCVSQSNKELESLDQTDQDAVDTYNKKVESCDKLHLEYSNAIGESLRISGEYFTAIFRSY